MNLKTITALAVLLCGKTYADESCCFYQGEILPCNCYSPAYNAPAKIDLQDRCCDWPCDVFVDASFIYWYVSQDGLALARSVDLSPVTAEIFYNKGSVELVQSFTYDPGFKVGLGVGFDEWELRAEYTWVRQKSFISSDAPTNETIGHGTLPVWETTTWFAQGVGPHGNFVTATHIDSTWRVGIDLLDITAGRPYYQGRNLAISPYGGMRAAWIRQSLDVAATVPAAALGVVPAMAEAVGAPISRLLAPQPIHSYNYSHSWAVGPTFGADSYCLLGAGFRVEGDAGFSILFTRYTKFVHEEDQVLTDEIPSVISSTAENYNCVRPMANAGLGLGWGKYFSGGTYHLDFAATYEFNVFWDQNMIRTLADQFVYGIATHCDLFLHGLTLTGRVDF